MSSPQLRSTINNSIIATEVDQQYHESIMAGIHRVFGAGKHQQNKSFIQNELEDLKNYNKRCDNFIEKVKQQAS